MLLTRECLNIPETRDYSALILKYTQQAERLIWADHKEPEVSDDAKIVISYLLFSRLEDLLSKGPYRFYAGQPYFLRREPLLARFTADYAAFIRETLENLNAMRGEISGLTGGWRTITGIRDCGGDQHNRGRCTLVVETDGGRFVYKPRDCAVDRWFMELADAFCSDYLYVPRVVTGRNCGLFEYVESTEADARRGEAFSYNLGRFCALVRMLGSVDQHRENLLVKDEKVVPVDLETILAPRERLDFFARSTGKDYTPAEYERLQTSLRPSALLYFEIRGEPFSILHDPLGEGRTPPPADGRQNDKEEKPTGLEAGFTAEYRRIWANKALYAAELCRASDCRIRTVIRNTRQYDAMLDLLFRDTEVAGEENILRLLRADTVPDLEAVCTGELEGLSRGDIPYFYTEVGSKDICCDGETAVRDFFEMSAAEQALHRLDTAGEAELEYELRLLRRTKEEDGSDR